ncbi:hypothetical protein ACVOMV_32800 [Mesorhizobium atlanticum]
MSRSTIPSAQAKCWWPRTRRSSRDAARAARPRQGWRAAAPQARWRRRRVQRRSSWAKPVVIAAIGTAWLAKSFSYRLCTASVAARAPRAENTGALLVRMLEFHMR